MIVCSGSFDDKRIQCYDCCHDDDDDAGGGGVSDIFVEAKSFNVNKLLCLFVVKLDAL